MAYSYIWPTTLPQSPQKGFTEAGGVSVLSTNMDQGPAKRRYRGKSVNTMQVSFVMTTSQVDTLQTFIDSTLKGTARFGFTHPRTKQTVEVRVVPQSNNLYNIAYLGPEYWTVNLQFEVLP
jgi:phage-related protein